MLKAAHVPLLISTLLLSPLASADVVSSDSTGFHVKQTHRYEDDATNAYRVFIDDIDSWWPVDHTWFGADGTLMSSFTEFTSQE